MNKNQILAPFMIAFGVLFSVMPLFMYSIVISKQEEIFIQFGVSAPSYAGVYVIFTIMIALGITNFIFGYKLLKDKKSEVMFKLGIVLAITSFFVSGILGALATYMLSAPIYELTKQF